MTVCLFEEGLRMSSINFLFVVFKDNKTTNKQGNENSFVYYSIIKGNFFIVNSKENKQKLGVGGRKCLNTGSAVRN